MYNSRRLISRKDTEWQPMAPGAMSVELDTAEDEEWLDFNVELHIYVFVICFIICIIEVCLKRSCIRQPVNPYGLTPP